MGRTFQLIEEFLESTTVHGFAYIHSTHPRISRFLWVTKKSTLIAGQMKQEIRYLSAYIPVSDSPCRIDAVSISDYSGISRMG